MIFRKAHLQINAKTYPLEPGRANSFAELYVEFTRQEERGGARFTVFLHPKEPVEIGGLELEFEYAAGADTRFFANGFQSGSESRDYYDDERIPSLRPLALSRLGTAGDDRMAGSPRGRGQLHSWTYTWLKTGNRFHLAGSLDERTGYSLWRYDAPAGRLTVGKDLAGLRLDHSFPALDVWLASGPESALFERYAVLADWKRDAAPTVLGWTTARGPAASLSSTHLTAQVQALAASGLPFTDVLIGEGWARAAGDWLPAPAGFPDGMGGPAAGIRAQGFQPGLALSPFVAAGHSETARRNPDWLLKDPKGRPLRAGWNPRWKGWYYALDFYHPGARDHLSGLFHTVFERWDYGLVHLDLLFAVALAPPPGKTRGQVMFEAMEFLRQLAGPRRIIAAGAPLGACFGKVDYAGLEGGSVEAWERRWAAWLRHRERRGALASLRSALGRWQLDGRMLGLAPGAFSLRGDTALLTERQRHTLLTLQALLGSALFTSDDPGKYTAAQRAQLETALRLRAARVHSVDRLQPDLYQVVYSLDDSRQTALVNLSARPVSFYQGAEERKLKAFEMRVSFCLCVYLFIRLWAIAWPG
jgi:alpha-galactosidase